MCVGVHQMQGFSLSLYLSLVALVPFKWFPPTNDIARIHSFPLHCVRCSLKKTRIHRTIVVVVKRELTHSRTQFILCSLFAFCWCWCGAPHTAASRFPPAKWGNCEKFQLAAETISTKFHLPARDVDPSYVVARNAQPATWQSIGNHPIWQSICVQTELYHYYLCIYLYVICPLLRCCRRRRSAIAAGVHFNGASFSFIIWRALCECTSVSLPANA